MMSPGELEAKGFIIPSYEIPGAEFSDAQAKILGNYELPGAKFSDAQA